MSYELDYNVSHWLPLLMRTRPLRMRRITWPVSRGSKTITFLESPTRFAYTLYNFYWVTTTIKGRLVSRAVPCKPFSFLAMWWPFCFMQIIRWKLKIRLGNRAHRIQHASIMLKSLVPHFYPKTHLDDYWRPLFRNPPSLHSAAYAVEMSDRSSDWAAYCTQP